MSWLPYLIVLAGLVVVVPALLFTRVPALATERQARRILQTGMCPSCDLGIVRLEARNDTYAVHVCDMCGSTYLLTAEHYDSQKNGSRLDDRRGPC